MQGLLKRAMALFPIFPSSDEVEFLREHNDFWRLNDTTEIGPGNDSEAAQEPGSEDGQVRVLSRSLDPTTHLFWD